MRLSLSIIALSVALGAALAHPAAEAGPGVKVRGASLGSSNQHYARQDEANDGGELLADAIGGVAGGGDGALELLANALELAADPIASGAESV